MYNWVYPKKVSASPYRKIRGYDSTYPHVSLTGRLGYDNYDYSRMGYDGYGGFNQDRVIGYLSSQDLSDNTVYTLYEVYDHRRGRPGYAYMESKDYFRDSVLVNIDPKKYSGDYLYDGDVINITPANVPYVVKLYTIKQTGLSTRGYTRDYRSEMQEYALLEPVVPNPTMTDDDKYFVLYEQEIDPHRQLNNYYIKDKRGIIIEITTKSTKLYDKDTIMIPGKEQYGAYKITVLDRY
jgi:ribosome-associated protein YbcJ (S4-like RNA binding protein)